MPLMPRMRRVRLCLAVVAASAVVGALAVAPAQAAPTWLSPQNLFSTPVTSILRDPYFNRQALQVGSDAAGNAVAVWVEQHPKTPGPGTECQAMWAARPAGGAWTAPAALSAVMTFCYGQIALAVNSPGTAVATWIQPTATGQFAQTATRPPGGSFAAPQTLSASTSYDPDAAINDSGVTAVSWSDNSGGGSHFKARVGQAGQDFAALPTQTVTDAAPSPTDAFTPRLAIDPQGNVTAVWVAPSGTSPQYYVQGAYRLAGQSFSGTATLLRAVCGTKDGTGLCTATAPGGITQFSPDVDVDGQGNVTIAWANADTPVGGSATKRYIEAAIRTPGASGAFVNAGRISSPANGEFDAATRVAVHAPSNTAAVAWVRCDNATPGAAGSCVVQAAARPAGTFGSQQTISGAGGGGTFGPVIAFDPAGGAIAIWGGPVGGVPPDKIQVTRRPPGSDQLFGSSPQVLSAADSTDTSPSLAFDNEGNAISVWQHTTTSPAGVVLQFDGFDGAPPSIGSLSAPNGVTGQALTFSATAFDRWSPFGFTWNFGDGTTATGATVSHAFAVHGLHGVTVTATDAVGNSSSAGATVTINCAPPPPNVKIDANCVKIPTPRVTFVPRFRGFSGSHGALRFTSLIVTKLTPGAKLVMVCKGGKKKGCPFSKKTIKKTGTKANLAKFLKKHTLKRKAVIEFQGTKAGFIGLVIDFTVKGGTAVETFRCMPAGSTKIQKTCAS
jgi:hypothetical protein